MALVTVTVPLVPSVDDPEIAPGFPVTAAGVTPVAPSGLSVTGTYPSLVFAAWRLDLSAVTAVCPAATITGVRVTTQSDVTAGVNDPNDGTIVGVYTDTGGPVSLIHSPDYTIATGSDAALLGFDIGAIRGFGGFGSTFAVPGPMDATWVIPAGTTTANVVGVMLIVDVNSGVTGDQLTQTVTSVEVTYDDALCAPPTPWTPVPVTGCNTSTAETIAGNAQLGPSGGFTLNGIGATFGYTIGNDVTASTGEFGACLVDLAALCPGGVFTPTGATVPLRATITCVGTDGGPTPEWDGLGAFIAQGAQALPPTVSNPPTTGDIETVAAPGFQHIVVRGYGVGISQTDTQPDTGQIVFTVDADPNQPVVLAYGGGNQSATPGMGITGVLVEIDPAAYLCTTIPPPPGVPCADPVTVCNQPAVRVERCHNGSPVLVEYQTDQNGRVLPFNTTGFHGTIRDTNGFVIGRGDQPASGANLWPNTLDNDCGAATPGAPLALNTGGVSIANGVHAATLGPDGTVWNNPGGVRSVTVAARRSATSDANPTGAGSNQVLVGTTLNKVVLLEGETVTWSVDDPDTLNVDWVETFGDSAALVVWTGV